jgi:nucleotide-binding universal stress UspA family protein
MTNRTPARDSPGGPCGMAERLAVLMKPGDAAGGKGPLLVMGAYDHPRLLEGAFGDTTQALLERAAVPILISH